jgi:type II secretory pathway component GspD/PulD (secretin)
MSYELKIKNLFVCGFVLLVMATTAVGDDPQATVQSLKVKAPDNNALTEAVDNNTLTNAAQMTVGAATLGTAAAIQSITFNKDVGIRDALRFLAAKYQKNIVPSPKVDGLIAVRSLYNVTFEEAMDAILGHGFRYEREGNFIKVYTEEEYKQIREDKSRMVHRVFTLYYVNAAEVKALITPLLSESGKIGTTTAAAVNTEAGQGGDKCSMRDTIVVYDFPERLDQIGRMIKEIDVKPQQILVEVTVLSAELTEDTEFGINWDTIGAATVATGTNGISVGLTNDSAAGGLAFGFANDKFVSLISALETVQNATVLANPKIMALNKQAGFINIGSQTGYTESTTQNSTGTTSSIAFLDSGTILRFRPFICDNGYIRMEINPEESTATTVDVNSGGITTIIPSKTLTQVKTNIMVKDGRTIIIGGLFREQLTSNDSQVPIVGDLPIIGALFKKTSDKNVRDELIILITPHIINEPEDLASISAKKMDDINRLVDGSRKRISPIARARIYEDTYAKAVEYYADKKYDKALAELNWIIGFRPDVLEAVQLKEKILTEVQPDRYRALERIMLDQIRKEQDVMWKRE